MSCPGPGARFFMASACPVQRPQHTKIMLVFFSRVTQLHNSAPATRNSATTCGRQGTSGMHSRGFHDLVFILMVTRILLLALISSHTAAVHCRCSVWVLHCRSVRGKRATPRLRGSACVSLRRSIGLGHRRWVCYPGSEGGNR